ncbi:hypothetical protein PAMP_002620 [Pampus punctatissimus]
MGHRRWKQGLKRRSKKTAGAAAAGAQTVSSQIEVGEKSINTATAATVTLISDAVVKQEEQEQVMVKESPPLEARLREMGLKQIVGDMNLTDQLQTLNKTEKIVILRGAVESLGSKSSLGLEPGD